MFKSYEELSRETCLEEGWLRENLRFEIPKTCFKDGKVDDGAFSDWYLGSEIISLSGACAQLAIPSGTVFGWISSGKLNVMPGIRRPGLERKFYYVKKADLAALVPDKAHKIEVGERPVKILPDIQSDMQEVETRSVNITPALAKVWLRYNYDYNRRLKEAHVSHLMSEIEAGRLYEGQVRFCVLPNGEHVLIDGQHLLTAMVRTNCSFVHRVSWYNARDQKHLSWYYRAFNQDGGKKALADLVKSMVGSDPAHPCCNVSRAARFAKALTYYHVALPKHKGEYGAVGKVYDNTRMSFLEDKANWPLLKFLEEEYKGIDLRGPKWLQPVVVSIIHHYMIDPEAAKDFWAPWLSGTVAYNNRDHRKLLHRWLDDQGVSQHKTGNRFSEADIFKTIDTVWKKWRAEKPVPKKLMPTRSDLK